MKKKTVPVTKGYAKVPQVMQMEALECGAASLSMVLAYYGKWLPLEQVRVDCGVSRDGSKAINILKAARNYGLAAKGYRYEPDQLKENGKYPCIIHWNFNHFVVLSGFSRGKAVINDPAKGIVKVDMEEFDKAFTGVAIFFEPSETFVPGGRRRSVVSFALSRLKGNWTAFYFVVLTTMVASIFSMISPAFSRIFLDRILSDENPEWMVPFLAILAGFTFVSLAVLFIQQIFMLKISGKLAITANSRFFWHVLRLPMSFFSQRMAGDLSERQSTNAYVTGMVINMFAPLMLQFISLFLYLFIILRYSVSLTLIGVASVLLNIWAAQVLSKKRINITRVSMRDSSKLVGTTVAGIEMIETIKASGAENGFFEKWSGYQAAVNTSNIKALKLQQFYGAIPSFINSLSNVAVLMVGVYLTLEGQFTIGMILAFQGYMSSFMAPAMSLISASQSLQEMRSKMERIEDVLLYQTDPDYNDAFEHTGSYDKLSGNVELKNIVFGYSTLEPPIIKDFSMTLRPGSKVAIVGTSGCGKSTLAKLISGLYQPWSGEILLDGKPRSEHSRQILTSSIAVVDQDVILFEDTIANNIKMWDDSIEDFEVILAARDAQLHSDIMQREDGYSYKITEGGKDFSGGQRQRMEIARVLAVDPTIIILDEATSALDAKTEFEVVNSINDRGITCIVIAHRLSTIRDCDEIIVLDKGTIVERGTHAELLARRGAYTQLVTNE